MIKVNARQFSRAWLAVSLASSANEDDPERFRAVSIELYDTGLRLTATDTFWLATCWCPLVDHDKGDAATIDELPAAQLTVVDVELRVRDLMKYVQRLTRKDNEFEELHLELFDHNEAYPGRPVMAGLEAKRVRFDLPGRERVFGVVHEAAEWVEWRSTWFSYHQAPTSRGSRETSMQPWMLTELGKIPNIMLAAGMRIRWTDDRRGCWTTYENAFRHSPVGLLITARPYTKPEPLDDDDDDPRPPAPRPVPGQTAFDDDVTVSINGGDGIPLTEFQDEVSHDLPAELLDRARQFIAAGKRPSVRMLARELHVGAARAGRLLLVLDAEGAVQPTGGRA